MEPILNERELLTKMIQDTWALASLDKNNEADWTPDLEGLKRSVQRLLKMMTQKTAGQRKNKPEDINWIEIYPTMNEIVLRAIELVLSGRLDELEVKHE